MSSTINIRVRAKDESSKMLRTIGRQVEGFARGVSSVFMGMGAAISGVVGGLGAMVRGAATAATDLSTLSKQTGIGVEELQGWSRVARESGTDLTTLAGGISAFASALEGAGDPNSAMAKALRDLKINLIELTPEMQAQIKALENIKDPQERMAAGSKLITDNLRPMNDLFPEIILALQNVEDPLKRAQLAATLFGGGVAEKLLPILAATPEQIQAIIDRGRELNRYLSEEQVKALDDASIAWKDMQDALEAVRNRIALAVLPIFNELKAMFDEQVVPALDQLTEKVQELANAFGELPDEVQALILKGIGLVAGLTAVSAAAAILSKLFTGSFGAAFGFASGAALLVIGGLVALGVALYQLWTENEEFRENVIAGWERIKAAATRIFDALAVLWNEHTADFKGLFKDAWEEVKRLVQITFEFIVDFIASALEIVAGVVETFMGLITGDWKLMGEGLLLIWEGLWNGIKAILVFAFKLIDGLLGGAVTAWFEAGKNIMTGLWDGIKSVASSVSEWVSGFVGGMVDKVKSVLKIQSPSQVFADIGENMMAGLQQGLQGAMGGPAAALGGAVPAMGMNAARGAVSFAPSIAVNGGTGMTAADFQRMLDTWWHKAQREIG